MSLRCPVRGCQQPLRRDAGTWTCERRHSFDVARSGHVNLLQPDERRSAKPGDAPEIVRARRRVAEAGLHGELWDAVLELVARQPAGARRVLDVGCGEGTLLARLSGLAGAVAYGLDLSATAASLAARRAPSAQVVVGNADRQLPFLDESLDAITCVNARVPVAECARALAPGGLLVVAVPGARDLEELREEVLGAAGGGDRLDRLRPALAVAFDRESEAEVVARHALPGDACRDVLAATYRGARRSQATRVAELGERTVTSHHVVAAFRRRSS